MLRIEAEERIDQIMNYGIAFNGNQKEFDKLQRIAAGPKKRSNVVPTPAALALMGMKLVKVEKHG